jgi:cytoskeletal protein CcmA (bactofilin family)
VFNRSAERMDTVIGPGVTFKGSLRAQSGVRLDGIVEGDVETTGNVIVGEKGQVAANITAQNVFVSGYVKGNVTARGRLEISGKGKLWGDMKAETLAVEEGGVFRGQSAMTHSAFGQEVTPPTDA